MADLRRQFEVPEFDREFLERRGLPWEAVLEAGIRWVVLHEHPVISGYNLTRVSAALQMPQSYPETQIDMVYFFPHLSVSVGKAIGQLTTHNFDGKSWQRWSRHRSGENPWRRGYDCVETHLLLVNESLERELRPAA